MRFILVVLATVVCLRRFRVSRWHNPPSSVWSRTRVAPWCLASQSTPQARPSSNG